ncbi:hypothetical protein AB1Y20_017559 [Prymnesium parvum]|uniref:Uncharacterized protein n=1 Tax=Prymnesium parvum TaxID=97485 RepID=A0AB34JLY5_PRYPA
MAARQPEYLKGAIVYPSCQAGVTNLGQLGTKDKDALDVAQRSLFSAEELERKAEAAIQRRIQAGIADAVEGLQPDEPPAFDQQLVGKRLEMG